jgi:hypothetical protein
MPLLNAKGEPIKVHQSGMRLFADCPHAFWLHYIQDEPQIVPPTWKTGTDIHAGLARYAEICWREGKRPVKRDPEAMDIIARSYQSDAVQQSLRWFAKEVPWSWGNRTVWDACPVEQKLSAVLPCGETFVGTLDLVTLLEVPEAEDPFGDTDAATKLVRRYLVADWKSRVPDELVKGPGAPLQLRAYSWLLAKRLAEQDGTDGCADISVTATYIEVLAPHLRGNTKTYVWNITDNDIRETEKDIDAWVIRLQDMLAHGADAFEPQPGAPCPWCNVCAACKYAETRTVQEYAATSPAERAARWGALKGIVSQLEPMVKEDSGGVYRWGEKSGWACNRPTEFVDFCEARGVQARTDLSLPPKKTEAALFSLDMDAQSEAIEQGMVAPTSSRVFELASRSDLPAAECQEKQKPKKGKTTRVVVDHSAPVPAQPSVAAAVDSVPTPEWDPNNTKFLLSPEELAAQEASGGEPQLQLAETGTGTLAGLVGKKLGRK